MVNENEALEAVADKVDDDIDPIPKDEPNSETPYQKTPRLQEGPMIRMKKTPRYFLNITNLNSNLE